MANPINRILIVGASVRPWTHSALAAGIEFVGLDFFADWDAQATIKARAGTDSKGSLIQIKRFQDVIADAEIQRQIDFCDAAIFCGGFETRIEWVKALETKLRVLGPTSEQLGQMENPISLFESLQRRKLRVVETKSRLSPADNPVDWVAKSSRSSGGSGVRVASSENCREELEQVYFQRRVLGEQVSAVFASFAGPTGRQLTRLIGTTKQLVGESDFGAREFQYCGSLTNAPLDYDMLLWIMRAGVAIGKELGLIGLWGVDFVLSDSQAFPVDINPRLTASMELFESLFRDHPSNCRSVLELHLRCCLGEEVSESDIQTLNDCWNHVDKMAEGKAVVFGKRDCRVSANLLAFARSMYKPQQFNSTSADTWIADIPANEMNVSRGEPILTIRTRMRRAEDVRHELVETAEEIYRLLDGAKQ